jgi:uncharacterized membrane protein YhaH (DUF805 family)
MKELLTTKGRISRSTFWIFLIFLNALLFVGFLSKSESVPEVVTATLGLLMFPVLIVGIIMQIKRWHDRDKSGWWVLINFIPIVGGLWCLVECGFLKGTDGPNRFGPDPLQV